MNESNTPMEQLRRNWVIIMFIGGLISTWTFFSSRLTQAEGQISELSQVVSQINQINLDIARIQKDVEFIKTNIK